MTNFIEYKNPDRTEPLVLKTMISAEWYKYNNGFICYLCYMKEYNMK